MKQSQLKRALAETETRLEKARTDLAKAQEKVRTLTQKIPELQQAVNSLRVLVGTKPAKLKKAVVDLVPFAGVNVAAAINVPPRHPIFETGTLTPEQALKMVPAQDLSGMGSIPYNKDVQPSDQSEELPDVEGEEILD